MNSVETIYLITEDEKLILDCCQAINNIDSSILTQVSANVEVFNRTVVNSGLSTPCLIVAEIESIQGFSELERLLSIGSNNQVPIVIVSESFENGLEELTLNYGDMRYYSKPLPYKIVEKFFQEIIEDRLK